MHKDQQGQLTPEPKTHDRPQQTARPRPRTWPHTVIMRRTKQPCATTAAATSKCTPSHTQRQLLCLSNTTGIADSPPTKLCHHTPSSSVVLSCTLSVLAAAIAAIGGVVLGSKLVHEFGVELFELVNKARHHLLTGKDAAGGGQRGGGSGKAEVVMAWGG